MNQAVRNNTWVVILTLTVALLLDILPMPSIIAPYWPKWVALVLLYWSLALPHRYGLITAWVTGLFVDALEGTLLGLHGLCFSVMVYFVILSYQRIRLFPRWKQSLVMGMLVGIYMLLAFWLKSLTLPIEKSFTHWLPIITSGFAWVWVFIILRDLRRYLRVQ